MLNHDLDVRTHLRTTSKMKALVNYMLDDKQRLLLKYSKTKCISLEAAQDRTNVQAQKDSFSNSKDAADIIFKELNQPNVSYGAIDDRFLKGLTETWVLEKEPLQN